VRRPAPAAPLRSSTSATRRPPPRGPVGPPPRAGGDNRRTPVIAAAAIAGVVLVVVGAIALIGGGGDEPEPAADSTQPAQTAEAAPTTEPGSGVDEKQPPTISRAETNVAVLNGTAIDGLASRKNEEIEQAGYTISQDPTNYTDQARSASIVFYNGSENRAQAFEVAKLLQISDRQPIIDAAAQLAPGADVVVVLGSDQG
jgi:hypothetical protein